MIQQEPSRVRRSSTSTLLPVHEEIRVLSASDVGDENESSMVIQMDGVYVPKKKHNSLCFFSKDNTFRRMCTRVLKSPLMNHFVLLLILFNTVCLAIDNPNDAPNTTKQQFLAIADVVLVFIFGIEMLIKLIAQGLTCDKGAYLKEGWNVIDFLLVVLG